MTPCWEELLLFIVVQLLGHIQLFATPQTAARQASLSFTISWSLLRLMSIELMMPSNSINVIILDIFQILSLYLIQGLQISLSFRWLPFTLLIVSFDECALKFLYIYSHLFLFFLPGISVLYPRKHCKCNVMKFSLCFLLRVSQFQLLNQVFDIFPVKF